MFYAAIYSDRYVGLVYAKASTIEKSTEHLRPENQPICIVFAETREDMNLAIKEVLHGIRASHRK